LLFESSVAGRQQAAGGPDCGRDRGVPAPATLGVDPAGAGPPDSAGAPGSTRGGAGDGGAGDGGVLGAGPLDWSTVVVLELLVVAEPVVIDTDEDPDEELAVLDPVDAVASI
jgi:hypothetical protein